MSVRMRDSFRRWVSMLLVGIMMLGICQPVFAAGASSDSGVVSGTETATVTVDWNMKGAAVTGSSAEKDGPGAIRINATPKDWKEFIYRNVHAGDTISFDTRDDALPFIESKVSEARDYGESVPRAELAAAMGVSEAALGSSVPDVRNGNCYLIPDIPNMSSTGSGYVTVLAVYRGLSWNGNENVIPGTEAIGTEMYIPVPADMVSNGSATLTAQWDFYGFPTTEKLFDGTGMPDAPSTAEKAEAVKAAEAEAAGMAEESDAAVAGMSGSDGAADVSSIAKAAVSGMAGTAVAALSDLGASAGIAPLAAGDSFAAEVKFPETYNSNIKTAEELNVGVCYAIINHWELSDGLNMAPYMYEVTDSTVTGVGRYALRLGTGYAQADRPVYTGDGDWRDRVDATSKARPEGSNTYTSKGAATLTEAGRLALDMFYTKDCNPYWAPFAQLAIMATPTGTTEDFLADCMRKSNKYLGISEEQQEARVDLVKSFVNRHEAGGVTLSRFEYETFVNGDGSVELIAAVSKIETPDGHPEPVDGQIVFDQDIRFEGTYPVNLNIGQFVDSPDHPFVGDNAGPYIYYVDVKNEETGRTERRYFMSESGGATDVTRPFGDNSSQSACHNAQCKPSRIDVDGYDDPLVEFMLDVAYYRLKTEGDVSGFINWWTMAQAALLEGGQHGWFSIGTPGVDPEGLVSQLYEKYGRTMAGFWYPGDTNALALVRKDINLYLSWYNNGLIPRYQYGQYACDCKCGGTHGFIGMASMKPLDLPKPPKPPIDPSPGSDVGEIPHPGVCEATSEIYPVIFNYAYTGGPIVTEMVGKVELKLIHTGEHGYASMEHEITFGFYDPEYQFSGNGEGMGWYRSRYIRPGWMFAGWSTNPIKVAEDIRILDPDKRNSSDNIFNGNSGFNAHKNGYYSKELKDDSGAYKTPDGPTTFYGLWIANEIKYIASDGYFLGLCDAGKGNIVTRGNVNDYAKNQRGVDFVNDSRFGKYFEGRLDEPTLYVVDSYYYPVPSGSEEFLSIMGGTGGRREPLRMGYDFVGWYYDEQCMVGPIDEFETGIQPGRSYFAAWKPDPVYVRYYDTREGGKLITEEKYAYGDTIQLLDHVKNTDGQKFVGWVAKPGTSQRLPTNLTLTNLYRYKGNNKPEATQDLLKQYVRREEEGGYPGDTQEEWVLDWDHAKNGQQLSNGMIKNYDSYWVLNVYTSWSEKHATYEATINWKDFNNNDGSRPKSVKVGLRSSLNDRTVQEADITGDPTVDQWTHTFLNLPITTSDASVEEITYDIYIMSYTDNRGGIHEIADTGATGGEIIVPTVSDGDTAISTTYRYGINNYATMGQGPVNGKDGNRAYKGKITMDYGLITTGTDIKFTIQWDDDHNRDGQRPGAVQLVLLADGVPVEDLTGASGKDHNAYAGVVSVNPGMCEISDDGDTWTYTFKDFQRYKDGKAIKYTVAVVNDGTNRWDYANNAYSMNGYKTKYLSGNQAASDPTGAVLSYKPKEVEVPFTIVWKDSNNRDGQRPDYVSVALTSYQWNSWNNVWEHMDTATQTVKADGINTMTADTWSGTFGKRFAYNGGEKVIYHLSVISDLNEAIPEGSYEYGWVETAHGSCVGTGDALRLDSAPEVTISQNTNVTSTMALVHWNDARDNDGIRPENIILQLYSHAPGGKPEPVEGAAYRVNLTGDPQASNWYYTFSGMPKYAEGQSGVELIYTVQAIEADGEPLYGYYVITANGEEEEVLRYEASYLHDEGGNVSGTKDPDESDRAYVKLSHITETKTMNFSVNWHDGDDRDGVRPASVPAALYKTVGDGEPVYLRAMNIVKGDSGTWTQKVKDLPAYEGGKSVKYTVQVPEDAQRELAASGYTVTVQDNIIHMRYTPKTGSVSVKLYWSDGDNNDGYRPDSVVATLYANGVSTGKTIDLNGTNGWSGTWSDLDVFYVDGTKPGMKVAYSVSVTAPDGYTAAYEPASTSAGADEVLYIRLTHEGDMADVPVKVYWNDSSNNDCKRPETLDVLLLADGQPTEHTLTLDGSGNVWTGVFENMPVYGGNGQKIYYSLKVYDGTTTTGGYSVMTAGTTLYLSYKPVKSSMYVSFQFDDGFNADGVRPTGLYLQLTADGVPVEDSEYKHTVSFDTNVDGYVWNFGELPVYAADGTKIAYNVEVTFAPELGATDYEVWTSADIRLSESAAAAANQIIVKLSRDVATTVLDGRIYWFDCNDVAGQRPGSLDLVMRDDADGSSVRYEVNARTGEVTDRGTKAVVGKVTVAEWTGDSSVWNYTISGVPERYAHKLGASSRIYYYVTANTTSIARYYPTVLTGEDYGMDVALTHKDYEAYAEKASQDFTVDVMWLDNSNAWGYRPDSNGVKVDLLANGEVYDSIVLTQADIKDGNDNAWTHTFKDIPTYRNGGAIVWSAALPDLDRYTQARTVSTANAATFAYTQAAGFDLSANWDDSDNDDAVRPESVTVDVYGDGEKKGSVTMSGEGNTWTGSISGLPVWRTGDPDAAVQYTFRWNDGTEQYLTEKDYAAFPTRGGESVSSDWSYWLSTDVFGDNTVEGYDQLAGTYDWETTLRRQQEKADRYFTVTFDDGNDRDGIRPESVKVELLANGNVADTREVPVNTAESVYTLTWEQLDVYEAGKAIEYTIRLADAYRGYKISYNVLNTAATLRHEPLRIVVTGTVEWDDSTQLVDVYNAKGQYVRSYEQIQRAGVYVRLLADGEPCGEPVYISKAVYGEGEKLEPSAIAEWEGLYKYRDNGAMIEYTMEVYSDELQALLDDGHSMLYDFSARYEPKAVITHDLYDIRGSVYYMYDYSDDFLLKGVPVTAYLQNSDGSYEAVGSAVTGEDGTFEILNLPQGLYIIRATYEYGGNVLAGAKGAALDRKDASATVIIDREAVNDSDRYRYAASGSAYYQTDAADGSTVKPVPEGSVVLLYRLDDGRTDPTYVGMTTTDADGRYRFEGLAAADYVVNVVFNYDGGTYTYDNSDALADGLSFNVLGADASWPDIVKQVNANADIKDPDVPVDPPVDPPEQPEPCVVSGSVFYADGGVHTTDPVEGVDVYVYLKSNVEVGHAVTDENGRWSVEGLGAADYIAVFSYQGSASRVLLFTITDESYEAGTYEAAPQYFDRTVETPGGTVRGVVLDESGLTGRALVGIYSTNGTLLDFAYTDTYGNYEFTVAAGYDYNVRILAVEDEVERLPAGDPDDALTTLDYYELSGTFHIDGAAQAGQLVVIYYEQDGEYSLVTATLTDKDGKFAVKVYDEGNYRVCPYVNDKVYETRNVSVGYQEERPHVSTAINGSYTVSGIEDYQSLTLYKITDGVETTVHEGSGAEKHNYEIGNLDAGQYRLKLVNGGSETWYYFTCPEGTLVDVDYYVTVSGSVLDDGGSAVAGAKAEIFDSKGEPAGEPVTILSDGGYAWHGLPGGEYTVVVTRPNTSGVIADKWTYEPDSYGQAYKNGMASKGTWTWNVNAHVVSGRVADQKGEPIAGARVTFARGSSPEYTYVATTDADGRYAIGLAPGEYRVNAVYHWDASHSYGAAGTIHQRVEGDVSGVDFTIARHELTIRAVREADGLKAPGTELEVRYEDGTLCWNGEADGNGIATLTVFPGKYGITGKYDGSGTAKAEATVTGDMEVVLELDSVVYITGTVRDGDGSAVPDGLVYYDNGRGNSGFVYTDDNGRYEIPVSSGALGGYEVYAAQGTVIGEKTTIDVLTDVVLDLLVSREETPEDHVISGVVTDEDGNRLVNALVTVTWGNDKANRATTSTDRDGVYAFTVTDGTYYLTAAYEAPNGERYETNSEAAVHVNGADTEKDLMILMGYEVEVTVVNANGEPVENAAVLYEGAASGEARTGSDGTVSLHLPKGGYEFRAETESRSSDIVEFTVNGPGSLTLELENAGIFYEEPEVSGNGLTIWGFTYDPEGKPVEGSKVELYRQDLETLEWSLVGSTETDAGGRYEFSGLEDGTYRVDEAYAYEAGAEAAEAGHTVSGTVADEYGDPLSNCRVELWTEAGDLVAEVTTDDNGEYTFDGVDPDESYVVKAWDASGEPVMNEAAEVTATSAVISGTALDVAGNIVPGAVVKILDTNGDTVATTVADKTGYYSVAVDGQVDGYTIGIEFSVSYEIITSDYTRDTTDRNAPYLEPSWYTIEGYVHDNDGKPVEGAEVILTDAGGAQVDRYVTEADGYYVFDHLEDGVYHVHVISPDGSEQDYTVKVGDDTNNIDVTVTNYSKGTVTDPDDGWYDGWNTFTVECGLACLVYVKDADGSMTKLEPEKVSGDAYQFTANLSDGDEIVVLVRADVNMDGKLTLADLVRLSQYNGGKYELSEYGKLTADVNQDGKLTLADLVRLSQYNGGKYELTW